MHSMHEKSFSHICLLFTASVLIKPSRRTGERDGVVSEQEDSGHTYTSLGEELQVLSCLISYSFYRLSHLSDFELNLRAGLA